LCGVLVDRSAGAADYTLLHVGGAPNTEVTVAGSTIYGTTQGNTVFKMNTDGSGFQTIYSFSGGSSGVSVLSALTLAGSKLFGEFGTGGAGDAGGIFEVNTDGSGFQILHSFDGSGSEGAFPSGGLTMVGSTLYGTTQNAGTGAVGADGGGTVFEINTDGSGFQVLHDFAGGPADRARPICDLTVIGSTLFGTTQTGGANRAGTVFSLNADGTGFQLLHSFGAIGDGSASYAGLAAIGNTLYGTAADGGPNSFSSFSGGVVFSLHSDGSGYQILHAFGPVSNSGGSLPAGDLTINGATIYGTTLHGGPGSSDGTVFSLSLDGTGFQVLHGFAGPPTDTGGPEAGVVLSGSTLYGTCQQYSGSPTDNGGVYALTVPEPRGFVLGGLGIACLALLRRNRHDPCVSPGSAKSSPCRAAATIVTSPSTINAAAAQ